MNIQLGFYNFTYQINTSYLDWNLCRSQTKHFTVFFDFSRVLDQYLSLHSFFVIFLLATKTIFQSFLNYIIYLFVCVLVYSNVCVMGMCIPQQNGSQNNFQELFLCFLMSPGLNLDCQAWQQAPLPAEPFASPVCQKFLICLELSSSRNLMSVEYVNLSPCSQKVTACVNMHCGIWCIHYNSGVIQQPVKSSSE